MEKNNITAIHLLGFPGLQNFKVVLFVFLLLIYCLILIGNILVITLVSISKKLQSPMYIFLTQLSLLDILVATDILPNMLNIILHEGSYVSFICCIIQLSVFVSSECSECFLLAVMSYDRYLAICRPMHYSSFANKLFCLLSVSAWIFGFFFSMIQVVSVSQLQFCGPNIIDHFYCDFQPLVGLSCSDTLEIYVQTLILGFITVACPFLNIVISYMFIIFAILKIQSVQGRQKTFLTCSSHLTAVFLFYGTLISVYVVPAEEQFLVLGKSLSLLYTVVTPLLNPVIYTIRNKDFKEAFEKLRILVI